MYNAERADPQKPTKIITKAFARDAVVDFRDGLTVAKPEHYTMLHGYKGREGAGKDKYAPNSVIKAYLCKFPKGKPSVNVQASIDMHMFYIFRRAAEDRCVKSSKQKPDKLRALGSAVQELRSVSKTVENQRALMLIGKLANAFEKYMEPTDRYASQDFHWSESHPNPYNTDEAGNVFVQDILITHDTAYNIPWYIRITNSYAAKNEASRGRMNLKKGSKSPVGKADIHISDADMFRMMSDICRYIDVFYLTNGPKLIRQGAELDRLAKEKFNNSR